MLGQRVITALILLPLIVTPILIFPTDLLYAFLSLIGLIAAWEWTALMGLSRIGPRCLYLGLVTLLLALAWVLDQRHGIGSWLLIAGAVWWIVALRLIAGYPDNFLRQPWRPWQMALAGLLMIVPAVFGLAQLHGSDHGVHRLFYLFALVWTADIGAYFTGRAFGRRKLAPQVSPGKTVEGALGGFAAAMAMTIAAPWIFAAAFERSKDQLPASTLLLVMGLSALTIAASIVGDLTESLFKRHRGVKDSGRLLPGHGGVLDRIDSLLAAAPVLALLLALTGI